MFGLDEAQLAFVLLVSVAAGGAVLALAMPLLTSSDSDMRVRRVVSARATGVPAKQTALGKLIDGTPDTRRRKVQESLKESEERERVRGKGLTLRTRIARAGLDISPRKFWILSLLCGLVVLAIPQILGQAWYLSALAGIVGTLGIPRWILSFLAARRQNAFRHELADAVDVMVRGLQSGMPLSDALRLIATESAPPIGPEFAEVVEGLRLGIPLDQGFERMFERVPLPEVSFLGIVISIQSKAGGNLSEALGNLSKVLRDRKKMKGKIRSMSQEAKSSAAIIGVLPFLIIGGLLYTSPDYLDPLLHTDTGRIILMIAGGWMLLGVIIMRSMINFDI